jgi:hypothetical protein
MPGVFFNTSFSIFLPGIFRELVMRTQPTEVENRDPSSLATGFIPVGMNHLPNSHTYHHRTKFLICREQTLAVPDKNFIISSAFLFTPFIILSFGER